MIIFLSIFIAILGIALLVYILSLRNILKSSIKEELSDILIEKGYTNPEGTELIKKPSYNEKIEMVREVITNSDKIKNKTLVLKMVNLYKTFCFLIGVFIALVIYLLVKIL